MSATPPPRPPPAVLNSLDAGGAQMMGNQFMGGFQQYMGVTPAYGMYDPYNRMGAFGGGFGGYSSPESNFLKVAEESSRNAFQSIESVVSAVTSVANMLNSTHSAIFNSFRAVIDIVEQIRSMKQQTSYAILAALHFLRMFWRRLLSFLRLRPRNYANSEMVWTSLMAGGGAFASETADGPTIRWSTLFFWVIAVGGPYLVYRCVSQMVKVAEESRKWASGDAEHYTAQALYNFTASNSQELSFRAYDMLRIAPKVQQPKVRDWLLASADGERIGLVPINYIKLINRNMTSSPLQSTSNMAAVVGQVSSGATDMQKAADDSNFESAFTMSAPKNSVAQN